MPCCGWRDIFSIVPKVYFICSLLSVLIFSIVVLTWPTVVHTFPSIDYGNELRICDLHLGIFAADVEWRHCLSCNL